MLTKVTRNDLDNVVKAELDDLGTTSSSALSKADQSLTENDAQDTRLNELEADVVTINDVMVKSVEGVFPDANGNIDLSDATGGSVMSVNSQLPDGLGNVIVDDSNIPVVDPYTGQPVMLGTALTGMKNNSVRTVDGNPPDVNGNAASKIIPKRLAALTDLNTVTTPGFHYSAQNADNCTNVPISGTAFSLLVEQHAGTKQTWSSYGTGPARVFVRNFYQTWGAWEEVVLAKSNLIGNVIEVDFAGLGVAGTLNGEVSFENVCSKIKTAITAKYGTSKTVIVRQLLSSTLEANVLNQFKAEINSLSNWKDITWSYADFEFRSIVSGDPTNLVTVKNMGYNTGEFSASYNNTSNTFSQWVDYRGFASNMAKTLYSSGGNNAGTITLSETIKNFDKIGVVYKTAINFTTIFPILSEADNNFPMNRFTYTNAYNYYNGSLWYHYFDTISMEFDSAGLTLQPPADAKFVMRSMTKNDGSSDNILDAAYGIIEIVGIDRLAVPRTSVGLLDGPEVMTPDVKIEAEEK